MDAAFLCIWSQRLCRSNQAAKLQPGAQTTLGSILRRRQMSIKFLPQFSTLNNQEKKTEKGTFDPPSARQERSRTTDAVLKKKTFLRFILNL